jgi:hypothetical protein
MVTNVIINIFSEYIHINNPIKTPIQLHTITHTTTITYTILPYR